MLEVFKRRPFKVRNADEYDLASILNLFVSPLDGLRSPFDFENAIIKGRMGSGKTMYLRANHAFYLYGIVPSLLEKTSELILPVFIRLSDFQHIRDPDQVYKAIVIKVVEELTSIYLDLESKKKLAQLHTGIRVLSDELFCAHKLAASMASLKRMGSSEYVERVSSELGLHGGAKHGFFEISSQWKKTSFAEFKTKDAPGIKDIEECYKNLLEGQEGKILLLIDEAGALDRSFFQAESGTSHFEVLMNQFRTASFIRTKIAVYPNSYSDMLTETRYGDEVRLEESVRDSRGYTRFYRKVVDVAHNYLNPDPDASIQFEPGDIFEVEKNSEYGGALEQLIYASNGNMRRLIHLLDLAMNHVYASKGATKVLKDDVLEALREHASSSENQFTDQERQFLGDLVSACRTRGGFKFTFPNMSPVLYKYTGKSQEHNLLSIETQGAGRRRTVYAFDYAYCVLRDIPTHYQKGSEKINRDRSVADGEWIGRTVQITQDVIDQASLPGKVNGTINFWSGRGGFILVDSGQQFFFLPSDVIESDRGKALLKGRRVRFYPFSDGNNDMAAHVEVLSES